MRKVCIKFRGLSVRNNLTIMVINFPLRALSLAKKDLPDL